MHQPSLGSVDGINHPGTARIDDAGAPGAVVTLTMDEVGRADVSRLHALHDRVAGHLRADRLPDHGPRAVAADQITAAQAADGAGPEIAQGSTCGLILDPDVF